MRIIFGLSMSAFGRTHGTGILGSQIIIASLAHPTHGWRDNRLWDWFPSVPASGRRGGSWAGRDGVHRAGPTCAPGGRDCSGLRIQWPRPGRPVCRRFDTHLPRRCDARRQTLCPWRPDNGGKQKLHFSTMPRIRGDTLGLRYCSIPLGQTGSHQLK